MDRPDNDPPHDAPETYEVGYGRPPQHTRFGKGQSGNPRGRRKGSRGLKTDLHAELAAAQTIHINGRPEKGTRQQLMVRTLATRAATGDVKAAALLLPLILQVFGADDRGQDRTRLSAQDEKLLDEMMGHYQAGNSEHLQEAANPELDELGLGDEPSGSGA